MKSVWLDCDPGHDDLLALLLAAFSPELQLLGVSSVHGNASLANTTANAARALIAFNAPQRVHPGRAGPILRSQALYAPGIHGNDGLGGVQGLPEPNDPRVKAKILDSVTSNATEGLKEACLKMVNEGRKLTLLATGSLSNVAAFLLAYPGLAGAALDQLLYMGGAVDELGNSNDNRSAEWNVFADPEATDIVLSECPCPIYFFPLDVTHQAVFRSEVELKRLQEKKTTQRLVIETAVAFFRETYKEIFGFQDPPCHDVLTSAFAIRPDLFVVQEEKLMVDKTSGADRGRVYRAGHGRTVQVAKEVKLTEMWELLFDALERSEKSVERMV